MSFTIQEGKVVSTVAGLPVWCGGFVMFDVIIIGAGVIGGSIFRELVQYDLKILVLDKENDVAMGATKANSAIVHAGFDPVPGSVMAKYNVIGNKMYRNICEDLDVPYENNGALVVAFDSEDVKVIENLYKNGKSNGVGYLSILGRDETLSEEPNLNLNVKASLQAKTSSIICPFQYTIALFENGISNGGRLELNEEVTRIDKVKGGFCLFTNNNRIFKTKFLVNSAGIYSDRIHNMVLSPGFSISARLGEYIIFNKSQGNLFKNTIFQCPTENGKGVLVSRTVHGNLFIGPDAVNIDKKDDVSTRESGLDYIVKMAKKTTNKIDFSEALKNYAGVRAMPSTGDFIITNYKELENFVDVSGIKSPGLTCAPAIAKDVVLILEDAGLSLKKKLNFNPIRRRIRFSKLSDGEKIDLMKKDGSFGRIVCGCEGITEGEVLDAVDRSFSTPTVCGVKRRCRAGMGKCQGGFCTPLIVDIISQRCGIGRSSVCLDSKYSSVLLRKIR